MAAAEEFGRTGDGRAVARVTLAAGTLTARVIGWGAAVQDLRLAGHDAPLVLGYQHLSGYEADTCFLGATAGRYANRIRRGRFTLDGERCEIDPDRPERHGLHGGTGGFGRRVWSLEEYGPDFATFALHDPDGSMGFPGALDVRCTYRLRGPATLAVELTATTDRPTLCNLAHHSYFNLDDGGSRDIGGHRLAIEAAAYLPVDGELLPTGVVQPVDGTEFDFRAAREIGRGPGGAKAYDHNFCLSAQRGPLRRAAWAQGATSGVEMEVWTTEPGVQFYSGEHLVPLGEGLGSRHYQAFAGFCLEPQVWPDSPNRPYFPQAVLRPGETYRQLTEYRFSPAPE